jgi:nitrite reductase/ring-hydroxylating ferredoxin subunit
MARAPSRLLTSVPLALLKPGAILGLEVRLDGETWPVVVVAGATPADHRAWVNRCPHWGIPLNGRTGVFAEPDGAAGVVLRCDTHGARFDGDGLCVLGPCQGRALTALPTEVTGRALRVHAPASGVLQLSGLRLRTASDPFGDWVDEP